MDREEMVDETVDGEEEDVVCPLPIYLSRLSSTTRIHFHATSC